MWSIFFSTIPFEMDRFDTTAIFYDNGLNLIIMCELNIIR